MPKKSSSAPKPPSVGSMAKDYVKKKAVKAAVDGASKAARAASPASVRRAEISRAQAFVKEMMSESGMPFMDGLDADDDEFGF